MPKIPQEHGRFPYSPIIDREPLRWPTGARVAVWVIPNIEHFLFDRPATRNTDGGLNLNPDVLNYSWRDYGVRVGIWRMMEIMQRRGFKGTVALNSDVCTHYPRIIEEGNKLGWEWMGHGRTNSELINKQTPAQERALIKEVARTIKASAGKAPRGWLSPALSETVNMLDILAENGFDYVCNWVNDEQPYTVRVKKGSMILQALFVGDQRHPRDAGTSPQRRGVRPDDPRPVRRALRGRRDGGALHVDLPAPFPGRRAAPRQVLRSGARSHQVALRGVDRHRQRDRGLLQGTQSCGDDVSLR